MITFRQKEFTEYDAMRSLYNELMRNSDRYKFPTITPSQVPGVLSGNNILIEKFVISTSLFHVDKYRIYLKIGAKAKLPDEVRLPGQVYDKRLGNLKVEIPFAGFKGPRYGELRYSDIAERRLFDNTGQRPKQQQQKSNQPNNKPKQNKPKQNKPKQNDNNKGGEAFRTRFEPDSNYTQVSFLTEKILAEAIVYDKKSRTLVLEGDSISEIIRVLNILPFGLNYKIYLLDA